MRHRDLACHAFEPHEQCIVPQSSKRTNHCSRDLNLVDLPRVESVDGFTMFRIQKGQTQYILPQINMEAEN